MQSVERAGCWVCWKRKLKCDSVAPAQCPNCAKRGVECQYGSSRSGKDGRTVPSQHITEAGIPRDRARRACHHCAAQKLKCSGDLGGCHRCGLNGLSCDYPPSKRVKRLAGSSTASNRSLRRQNLQSLPTGQRPRATSTTGGFEAGSSEPTPTASRAQSPRPYSLPNELPYRKHFARAHVNAYFEYVYPTTIHGFLHHGTFLERFDEDKVHPMILKAIAVLTARLVSADGEGTRLAALWANEVDMYIMTNLGTLSMKNLHLILLSLEYHQRSGDSGKVWMMLSLASRLAYSLNLNADLEGGSVSEAESRRRVMWHIFILDKFLAGSVDELSVCTGTIKGLALPCAEHLFLSEMPAKTATLEAFESTAPIQNVGVFAFMIRIICLWREILIFMTTVSRGAQVETIMQQVAVLRQRLADFEEKLPLNLKFVTRNIYLVANSPQRVAFFMLWLWWRECQSILYRFSLPGFRESIDLSSQNTAFAEECQRQALHHATSQSKFCRMIADMQEPFLVDHNIGILVYSNTKTLLACRKLGKMPASYDRSSRSWDTVDISELLASNKTLLLKLASVHPKIAIFCREITRLVDTNTWNPSSEAAVYGCTPMRRQLSREHLLREASAQVSARVGTEGSKDPRQGPLSESTDNPAIEPTAFIPSPVSQVTSEPHPVLPLNASGALLAPPSGLQAEDGQTWLPEAGPSVTGMSSSLGWQHYQVHQHRSQNDSAESLQFFGFSDEDMFSTSSEGFMPRYITTHSDLFATAYFDGNFTVPESPGTEFQSDVYP